MSDDARPTDTFSPVGRVQARIKPGSRMTRRLEVEELMLRDPYLRLDPAPGL